MASNDYLKVYRSFRSVMMVGAHLPLLHYKYLTLY